VLRDAEPPLRDRLAETVGRLDVGEPIEASLGPISQGSADGRLLAAVLSVHSRVGGDLPGLLDELSSVLAVRLRGRRQARALTAQARASGAVLAVLPIAFVGLLSGTSGAALGAFYRTVHGSLLLLGGLILEGFGFLWLRRISGRSGG
jgi:tight adherence protein B